MIAKFQFAGNNFFVEVKNAALYQQLILKNSTPELGEYAIHECLYYIFHYLNDKLPNLAILSCQESSDELTGADLIQRDLIIDQMSMGWIYIPQMVEVKISYLLGLESYLKLESYSIQDVTGKTEGMISDVTRVDFDLIHGATSLAFEEVSRLNVGDVVLLDTELAPNLLALNLGSKWFRFRVSNQQAIFYDTYHAK